MRRALLLLGLCLATGCTPLRPLDPLDAVAAPDVGPAPRDVPAMDDVPARPDAPLLPDALLLPDAPCAPRDLCDGRDDDCDPSTADGSDDPALGGRCDGPDDDRCEEGEYVACEAGALACDDGSDDTLERCPGVGPAGVDDDCDGAVDEDGALGSRTYYPDEDGDRYGSDTGVRQSCVEPPGRWASRGGDCDDTDPDVRPGVGEMCNAADDDCDGAIDDGNACDGCTTEVYLGHTYLFCEINRPHALAAAECAAHGYHLVKIEDAAENDWLLERSTMLGIGLGLTLMNGAWIGLSRTTSPTFFWEDGTDASAYANWASGEPNGTGACARFTTTVSPIGPPGVWGDLDCSQSLDFVCETP